MSDDEVGDPRLRWPRSDGDPSHWPPLDRRQPSSTQAWFTQLPMSDKKYILYSEKVGQHLASHLGIVAPGLDHRMHMPAGYALWAHNKPQDSQTVRTDIYLFGSTYAPKFRSPAEFFEHAEWLLDTTRPLTDHSQCGCKYNSVSEISKAKKSNGSAGPARHAEAKIKSRKRSPSEPPLDEEPVNGVVPDRIRDIRTGRHFRRGELVWFRTDVVYPPPQVEGLPPITHWPGLISSINDKEKIHAVPLTNNEEGSSSTSSAMNPTAGSSGSHPVTRRVITASEYRIRPLGIFSSDDEVVIEPERMLPWAIGNELLGGGQGWNALGREGSRVLRDGARDEVAEDKLHGLPTLDDRAAGKRWKARWAVRKRFSDLSTDWAERVFRLSLAMKIAATITNCWSQTDKIEVLPGADINAEDLQLITQQKKTLYQGLWWGGERIWMEDMVRLTKHRSDLPESLGAPSEGAENRAVLLRIRLITFEVSEPNDPTATSWRCLLYGDIFEVKARSDAKGDDLFRVAMPRSGELPVATSYAMPSGFQYHQLNDPGSEITVDILDVAGRLYPKLLDPSAQSWFDDPELSREQNRKDLRVKPGNSAQALTGLSPGNLVAAKSDKWKDDLYHIVTDAQKAVEDQMKGYYATLLRQARGDAPVTTFAPAKFAATSDKVANTPDTQTNGLAPVTLAQAMLGNDANETVE